MLSFFFPKNLLVLWFSQAKRGWIESAPPPPIRVKKSHQIKVMIRYYEYAMDDHQFVLIGLDTLVVGSVNGT